MRIKPLNLAFLFLFLLILSAPASAGTEETLAKKLAGKILLQVESRGEAWYINPQNLKKYYFRNPVEALGQMKRLSLGISNSDLSKIPTGLIDYRGRDNDNDGLPDRLENILGTDSEKNDSDNDGFSDKLELANGFNPLGRGKIITNPSFTNKHLGKIFLQVENKGVLWYLNPTDKKRYYLGEADDVSKIIIRFGLGIKNTSLDSMLSDSLSIASQNPIIPPNSQSLTPQSDPIKQNNSAASALSGSATAIRAGKTSDALTFFAPEISKRVKYSLDNLNNDGRLAFANLLSAAKESGGNDNEKTFSAETYFDLGGYKIKLNFLIKKQLDNSWLIANL